MIIAVGAALSATAAAMTAAGSAAEHPALEASARALMVGVPIGAGVYARSRPASARFGTLLVLTGAAWFLTTLAESSDPWLHAIGRIAGWLCEPLLIYLVLAFPTGRLRTRVDRLLVAAVTTVAVVLYVPSALFDLEFPQPTPWSSCSAGCPDNPFMILASEPAFLDDVLRPLREVLTVLLFAAVGVRLVLRLAHATRLMRRVLEPVLAVAIARFAAFAALIIMRAVDADSAALTTAVWALALSFPLLALAFLAGIANWHLFIADALQHLGGRLTGHPGPEELQTALAETFDDPSLQIVYPNGGGVWTSEAGRPVYPPPAGSDRWLTVIRDDGLIVAGILHDASLRDEEAFIESARAYTVLTLDNRRLGLEAAALLDEVRDSRMRIQASADEERRRVERDLHDGAQQRLVALRIKLELAAERIDGSDERSARLIRELGGDVDSALDEIRSLARGIYPSPLADRGLVEALRSAALQTVLPASVHADGTRDRYPRPIESAAYFCCLEAMQNAAKHAEGAKQIVLELSDNGVLLFEVRDDGEGFDLDAIEAGVGLTSMRDRLAAVGGELAIVTAPGKGTRVIGRIPLGQRLPRAVPPRRTAREF